MSDLDPSNLTRDQRSLLAKALRKELGRRRGMAPLRLAAEDSLAEFLAQAWEWIDTSDLSWNWHLDAIAEHLEAVTHGDVRKYLCNAPPRTGKTNLISVCWAAWTWIQPPERRGYLSGPHVSFMYSSHSQTLSEEIAAKFRQLVTSQWYTENWGDRLRITRDALVKIENSRGGYRIASSAGIVPTGRGAAILVVDDPIKVDDANSEIVRDTINRWWSEGMTSRLNSKIKGARVIQMQRVHADDLTGHIVNGEGGPDWCHHVIPMRYDPRFEFARVTSIGWKDPREEDGELLWPERFPVDVLYEDERTMGPYATAGQHQQDPQPRGGSIIQRDWWQLWPAPGYEAKDGEPQGFPPVEFVCASVDTAYGKSDEDAWNACTVWGVWRDQQRRPKAVLMEAWRMRGPLTGLKLEDAGMPEAERKKHWGLTEKVLHTARRRKVDAILIENKTRGDDLAHEIRKQMGQGEWAIHMIMPMVDKISRMHAVVPLFADKIVYAPDRVWSDEVIDEVTAFPKGKFADYSDTVSQALTWLRMHGLLKMATEAAEDEIHHRMLKAQRSAIYDV